MIKLKFKGDKGHYIPGVPARDLTQSDLDSIITKLSVDSEAEAIKLLTKNGLYSVVKKKVKPEIVDKGSG